ncbi:MAG: DUF1501 domain-containing protein [Planctomycetota bacterium]|nr:DUF1501 domain-containing protein [Planctomycetota bacterium]
MASNSTVHRHTVGLSRREALQVGYSGLLGLGLPALLGKTANAGDEPPTKPKRRNKSVILIFLTGAPSHLDMFDLKPEAPAEVRGIFNSIDTSAPGVRICEHLPMLAARAERFAVIRSMTHDLPGHEQATHFVLTGIDRLPLGATHMASRNDWPCYASALNFLRPRNDGIPNGVLLPTYLHNGYGFSGQDAGFLGAKFDPLHVKQDPNADGFRVDSLNLPAGLTVTNLDNRRQLLAEVDSQRAGIDRARNLNEFDSYQQQAFTMLSSSAVGKAFAIDQEKAEVRNRYGRHPFGQSLLLARRLVQAGVPIVQANMGTMNNWDTHNSNFTQLKDRLLPPLDRGVSALLDDLQETGLLDDTLLLMVGEFGRTPKLGGNVGTPSYVPDGRDHWSGAFFSWFAGGGVQGGQVIGASDNIAAYPATRPYRPSDLGATVYDALGIDPGSEIRDRVNRPMRLNDGEVIEPLFSGA